MIDKRYVLFKKVARGGMAEIYLGKLIGEDGFERVCCFKRILPHFSVEKEFIEMFRDEAHIGKRLQHPNVVRVEGFEEVEGAYAIVMEFINGADLKSVMASCSSQSMRVPVPLAVHIIAESARGLHYAHIKKDEVTNRPLGIVHRDISPQNILVSFDGEVKVTDFGIAEADSKITETKTGIVKGKFSYMSPEQIRAEQVDARTDVFALAIILWEMLTGQRLFNAENEVMIIQLVRECAVPPEMRSYNSEIDEELERIVLKALKKNVDERYETAAAFEKDLRLYLSKKYAGYSADDVGDFLGKLLPEKRQSQANDIKELLSKKEDAGSSKPAVEIDLRGTNTTAGIQRPSSTSLRSPLPGFDRGQNTRMRNPTKIANLGQTDLRRASSYTSGTRINQTTGRRPIPQQDNSTRNLILFILLIGLGIGAYILYFNQTKSKEGVLGTWVVNTDPSVTKILLDGQAWNNGAYVKTPVTFSNLSSGYHRVAVSRPGFQTEVVTENFISEDRNKNSNIVLRTSAKMAPLRIILKQAVPPIHFNLDDGLVDDNLSFEKPKDLNYVTFGREHILVINSDNGTFSCQFVPRSQDWQAPFLVAVDPFSRRCSYPLK